jgi:hypothetical protein
MRVHPFLALFLLPALVAAPARAGTYTIAPENSTITLGQTVTLTVSIQTRDPSSNPGFLDAMIQAHTSFFADGPPSVAIKVGNFQLAPVFQGSSFLSTDTTTGGASVSFGANTFPSFVGPLYSFDFTPTEAGPYSFAALTGSVSYLQGTDEITGLTIANILVNPATAVPEPGGLALAAVACGGLALRAWRRGSRRKIL